MRYGAVFPKQLVERAQELGMTRLGLTDRDGLYGAVQFALACAEFSISPIIGVDLPLIVQTEKLPTPAFGGASVDLRPPRVVVLARGSAGFAALNRLVTARHELGGISPEILGKAVALCAGTEDGLSLLLGPESDVGRAVRGRKAEAADRYEAWRRTNAEVFIEVVSHQTRDPEFAVTGVTGSKAHGLALSTPQAARLWRFAEETGAKSVLTNAVRHLAPGQARLLDVLDSARRLVPLSGKEVDRANGEGYLKDSKAMAELLQEIADRAGFGKAESAQLWQRTLDLATESVLDPQLDLGIGSVHVPELDLILGKSQPQSMLDWNRPLARRRSAREVAREAAEGDAILAAQCQSALTARIPASQQAIASIRLADELQTIASLGFASFFLAVSEVVTLTKQRGIRVAARGSGAGSLVNHLLGISALNPIDHGLIMERFLSPLRSSLPDIDIDVESHRRLEVYDAIIERFGSTRVACVSMMETYRVRHAIRDVAKALGLPPGETDVLAKSFPHIRARDARAALAQLPELRSSGLARMVETGGLELLLELVEGLDGLPRQVALHPCGVLLSDSALLDRTPVQMSAGGFPMSHYDKSDVETLGFLKLDVLGIRMQSAMAHAVEEIERTEGVKVELDSLDLADRETFELISSTKTLGCFQIESPGQRELVGKFSPQTFNDIVIDISLFRPGPVKSDMITPFLEARQGWRPAQYLHSDLRPTLSETCGVVVFHEQVIAVVSQFSGCSLAEADEVRRALGDWDRQPQIRAWFYTCSLKRGYDLTVVEEVWQVLRAFASFGFCKAHAAAFALPTYQSAWLKRHYPAAFYAGVLTHDPGMYPRRLILDDARQFGVPILGLDANRSGERYLVEEQAGTLGIRIPFSQVKGIAEDEVASLVAAQPFADLSDLWHRSKVTRPTAEKLVLAGALDELHGIEIERPKRGKLTRRDLFIQVATLERSAARTTEVFDLLFADSTQQTEVISGLPELTEAERISYELEILDLDVSSHLLTAYEPLLTALQVTRSKDLLSVRSNSEVLVAGVKVATQTPPVRSGKRVVFLTMDDSTGPIDAAFFEDAQGHYANTLFKSWLLLVVGKIRRTGPKGLSIRATGCWDLARLNEVFLENGGPSNPAAVLEVWAEIAALSPEVEIESEEIMLSKESGTGRRAGGMGGPPGRVRRSGFSPWTDVVPAAPTSKLWHTSPGSPG